MNILWFITGVSLVTALVAWRQARRNAKRLEQLTQMYWELKYQHGELRVQLQRAKPSEAPPPESAPEPRIPDGFVPLTSLKR
jgi:hypothetical protein